MPRNDQIPNKLNPQGLNPQGLNPQGLASQQPQEDSTPFVGTPDQAIDLLDQGGGEDINDWTLIGEPPTPDGVQYEGPTPGIQQRVKSPQEQILDIEIKRGRQQAQQAQLKRESLMLDLRDQRRQLWDRQRSLQQQRDRLPNNREMHSLKAHIRSVEGSGGWRLRKMMDRARNGGGLSNGEREREMLQEYETALNWLNQTEEIEQQLDEIPIMERQLREQSQMIESGAYPSPDEVEAGIMAQYEMERNQEQARQQRYSEQQAESRIKNQSRLVDTKLEDLQDKREELLMSDEYFQFIEEQMKPYEEAGGWFGVGGFSDEELAQRQRNLEQQFLAQQGIDSQIMELTEQKSALDSALEEIYGLNQTPQDQPGDNAQTRDYPGIEQDIAQLQAEFPEATEEEIREMLLQPQ